LQTSLTYEVGQRAHDHAGAAWRKIPLGVLPTLWRKWGNSGAKTCAAGLMRQIGGIRLMLAGDRAQFIEKRVDYLLYSGVNQ
jgi:hypothetical protein